MTHQEETAPMTPLSVRAAIEAVTPLTNPRLSEVDWDAVDERLDAARAVHDRGADRIVAGPTMDSVEVDYSFLDDDDDRGADPLREAARAVVDSLSARYDDDWATGPVRLAELDALRAALGEEPHGQ